MRYRKRINLWTLTHDEIRDLHPGQWVYNGEDDGPDSRGQFWGVLPGGTVVVSWAGNARHSSIPWGEYVAVIRRYAAGR